MAHTTTQGHLKAHELLSRPAVGVLAVILTIVLAGCASAPEPTTSERPTCAENCMAEPNGRAFAFHVRAESSKPFDLSVGLPHAAWCLQPQEWMAAVTDEDRVTVRLAEAPEGRTGWVLQVSSVAREAGIVEGQVSARINVTNRAECQTLRFDPWSTDPDAEDGAPEVFGTPGTFVMVATHDIQGTCWIATAYEAVLGDAWTPLPYHTSGEVCSP